MDQYYIIVNGQQAGPMSIEEMRSRGVNAETIVWKAGMADWTKAANVPELMMELHPVQQNQYQQPMQPNPYQQQPMQQNPYQQEYPQTVQQNQYQQPGYGQQNPYQQRPFGAYEAPHTNWLPWAIVGTVLGLCSFIGLILGIIAITKANNANKLYAQGANTEAETANNSAKTFSIVSLCFGGFGLLVSLIVIAAA